jgi:protein-disulfide isomerase
MGARMRLVPLLLCLLLLASVPGKAAGDTAALLRTHWDELINDPASPAVGNPGGDLTIVEFFDYQCVYCKADEPIVQKLLAQDKKLRLVYKEVPLLGPLSVAAAHAALAAARQDKYEPFRTAMLGIRGALDQGAVYLAATVVGLDTARLTQDMKAPEVERQIAANLALAKALDIEATPVFVIGDEVVDGAIDLSGMKILIAKARKK